MTCYNLLARALKTAQKTIADLRLYLRPSLEIHSARESSSGSVAAQPWDKSSEVEPVCFVEGRDENVDLLGIRCETPAVDGEKSVRGGESRPFVPINERMVLRETLP